jgi:hypothetical protein
MARKKLVAAAAVSVAQGSVLRIVRKELATKKFTIRVDKAAGLIHIDSTFFPAKDALFDDGNGRARVSVVMDFSVPGHVLIVAPWVWDIGASPHKQAILNALEPLGDRLGVVRLRYVRRHARVMPHVSLPADCVAAVPSIVLRVIGDLLSAVHHAHPMIRELMRSGKADINAFTFSAPWCRNAVQPIPGGRDKLVRFNERHARLLELFAPKVLSRPKALPGALVGMLIRNSVVAVSPETNPQSLKKFWKELDAHHSTVFAQVLYRETPIYRGTVVWSRDRKFRGVSTGGRRSCACGADRVFVRWDDGSRTWPCIKDLEQLGPNEFKIV